jgi:MFS family permease
MAGSMMQSAAILWQVSLLVPASHRGLALGLVGLVRLVPIVALSMVSGVAADALDRRRLMLVTQAGMAACAALLAAVDFAGVRSLWPIYTLAAVSSAFWAFDGPARQSLVPNLVPREHVPNAISLNTIMFQTAAVIGPALGGVVIARWGVGWAYAFNAVSFLFVIGALLLMRDLPARAPGAPSEISMHAAREGLRFVFRTPLIRSTMLLDFFATFFASATALLPIYAQDILHVGARGYGLLSAAPSVGAMLAGAALVPLIDRIERRGAAAPGRCGIRARDRRVRHRAQLPGHLRLPRAHRRHGHREHGHPQRHPPAPDARCDARADDEREHDVLHGRAAARRAGSRPCGPGVGRPVLGRERGAGLPAGGGVGRVADARAQELPARSVIPRKGRAPESWTPGLHW